MNRIVVTGAAGLVGHRLMQQLQEKGEVFGFYHCARPEITPGSWQSVDLQKREEVHQALDGIRPAILIHCAASCQPVHCEKYPMETLAVNYGGTLHLAEWAAEHSCFFLHVSTDLVFDGTRGHYSEQDAVRPISVYGWSKLAAEEAVRSHGGEWCIARTALVFGRSRGGNRGADELLVQCWKQGKTTPLFQDEYRTPTSVGELAEKLIEVADERITGLVHIAGSECLSRYEFGCKIAGHFGFPPSLLSARKIEDVVSVPPRAPNVSMNITKARALFRSPFRSIEENLRREHPAP